MDIVHSDCSTEWLSTVRTVHSECSTLKVWCVIHRECVTECRVQYIVSAVLVYIGSAVHSE